MNPPDNGEQLTPSSYPNNPSVAPGGSDGLSSNPNNSSVASGGSDGPSPCTNQNVPAELPGILKEFAKGAIQTQPPDLLCWSEAYFRAMANGEPLPVKDRMEYQPKESRDGLTAGIIRVLHMQLGRRIGQTVATKEVFRHWNGFGMHMEGLSEIFQRAGMSQDEFVDWNKVMSVMACSISQNITEVMAIVCEVFTEQPEGDEPVIPYAVWFELFKYVGITILKSVTPDTAASVNECLTPIADKKQGLIGPKDVTQNCPLIV